MYEYRCKLDRVVDGDTVDLYIDLGFDIVMKRRVRLIGVDTPEMNDSDPQVREAAQRAKVFVERFFQSSDVKWFRINTHKDKTGKYGRLLAEIHAVLEHGYRELTEGLLDAGHAEAVK